MWYWYAIPPIVTFTLGFFIGSNNPLSGVRQKIIQKFQNSIETTKKN